MGLVVCEVSLTGNVLGMHSVTQPPQSGSATASSIPPTKRSDLLQSAVRKINVRLGGGKLVSGTGFRVAGTDFVVTNAHVIEGAAEVNLVADDPPDIGMELRAVAAGHDLAVLAPKASFLERFRSGVGVLSLCEAPGEPGSDVVAVGYPEFGFTITKGVITGLRSFEDLARVKKTLTTGWAKDAKFVQTDAVINPGNSGGPLVSNNDRVVGVNAWKAGAALKIDHAFFAISVEHVKTLLAQASKTPILFPPASLAALPDQPKEAPQILLPPPIAVKEGRRADLQRAIRFVRSSCECSVCDGSGSRTVQRTRKGDGQFEKGTTTKHSEPCERCDGTGFRPDFNLDRLEELVVAIARTDLESEANKPVRDIVIRLIEAIGWYGAQPLARLAEPRVHDLFNATPEIVSPAADPVGVIVHGRVSGTVDLDDGTRLAIVAFGRGDDAVLLSRPKLLLAAKGDVVVAGGLVAGKVVASKGKSYLVLQSGFAIRPAQR